MELANLGYLTIRLNPSQTILYLDWNEESAQINKDEYKRSAFIFRELVLTHKEIKVVLNNLQRFEFAITPDLQDFISQDIMKPLFANGLQKMALVLPESLIPMLSTEQVSEEISAQNDATASVQTFYTIEEAEKWLQ
ncbi:MAG: hypothetical protein MUE85_22635 [Microscillaceae bacterium]|jgi:hypothetical protein|nr:hypothetical protein [Microscillaceae bacterium]